MCSDYDYTNILGSCPVLVEQRQCGHGSISDTQFHARCSSWAAAGKAASCMPWSHWRVGQPPYHRTSFSSTFAPQMDANSGFVRRTYPVTRSSSSTGRTTSCKRSTSTMKSNWKPSPSMPAPASLQHVPRAAYTYTNHTGETRATPRCED
jgi:hypothetical protein